MKKLLCCILAAALLVSGLSACQPTLRKAIEEQLKISERHEFELDQCFSEEDGFHYPGTPWGLSSKEFENAHYASVKKAMGYGDSGESYYSVDLRTTILERPNDDGQIAINIDDKVYMASVVLSSDNSEFSNMKQSEIYDQYLEKIIEVYGEPDDAAEKKTTSNNITTNTLTNYWNYTTADGKETQLQFAKAFTVQGAEPMAITLGFVWLNEAPNNETE